MAATLAVVTLEPSTGCARLTNAGHLPALVISAGRDADYLEHRSRTPLGVGGGTEEFPELEFMLKPGSALVMFTDGLVERRGESLDEGLERLRQVVAEGPSDLEDLCTQILTELIGDRPAADDVALLAVRVRPSRSGHLMLRLPAEASSVPVARHAIRKLLHEHGASADNSHALELAISEAAANAVEHAYDPGDHEFEVAAEVRTEGVYLTVSDSGRWRSPRGRARGLGLGLIKKLIDEVDVQRTENGTTLRMFKRMTDAPAPAGE
jgi:anti-sigma regulatory factor (Ser/Thr protein kinase)